MWGGREREKGKKRGCSREAGAASHPAGEGKGAPSYLRCKRRKEEPRAS